MDNIKGAIFDLDGTLLDSMPAWEKLTSRYLSGLGVTPSDDLEKMLLTMTLEEGAEYCCTEYKLAQAADEMLHGIRGLLERFYEFDVLPKPGAYDFLNSLHKSGVKICLATANYSNLAELGLQCTGLMRFMDAIVTCSDVDACKESSAVYDEALRLIGVEKSDAVIFEDALYAVKTAKAAGYRVIGVYDEAEKENINEIKLLTEQYIYSYEELV